MRRRIVKHHLDGLIALLLFGVFAVCILAVLLTGADAYRRLTERDEAAYDRRICAQYVATRVRQADSLEGVAVEEFGGGDALVLTAEEGYATRIYYHEGYIMELYSEAEPLLGPEAGEKIMEAQGLELSLEEGMLKVTAIDTEGRRSTLLLSLRSKEEVAA